MDKEKLTADQLAVAIKLSDELSMIYTQVERVKRLSIDIQEGYFDKNMSRKDLESLSKEERTMFFAKVMLEYDSYRVYSEILAKLACDLEDMVKVLCDFLEYQNT